MVVKLPESDLSRAVSSEPSQGWPMEFRVVFQWGHNRATSFVVSRDEYFGTGVYGAPLNGDRLMQKIEAMRRQGAPVEGSRR